MEGSFRGMTRDGQAVRGAARPPFCHVWMGAMDDQNPDHSTGLRKLKLLRSLELQIPDFARLVRRDVAQGRQPGR